MKNNYLSSKGKIALSVFSILSTASLIALSTNINNDFLTKLHLNKVDFSNQYSEAKVDTFYKVKTIRKTGNDADKINILFMNDNKDHLFNDENYFANWVYDNITTPWFSTKYPTLKEHFNHKQRGVYVPYQTFLNDKFNIYSIQVPSYQSPSLNDNSKSFFGIYNYTNYNDILYIKNYGRIKKNILNYDINSNFLQDSGLISYSNQNIIYFGDIGRANASNGFSLTISTDGPEVAIHEFGHSIYGLMDEYSATANPAPNRSFTGNPDRIQWKEFLNFRGVGIVNAPGSYKEYIPSTRCLMQQLDEYTDFCEVCTNHIIEFGTRTLGKELFYIADPQLTTKHPEWNDTYYTTEILEQAELYSFNIQNANNQTLEFRTVVNNITPTNRTIKLRITIKGKNNEVKLMEESPNYDIQPDQTKGLVLYTTKTINELKNNEDSIIGEVIDVKTNEVLATSLDRTNYSFLKQYFNDATKFYGKKIHKININFLDNKTKKPLEDIKPTTLIQRDQTTYKLEKILFQGYKFVSSDHENMEVKLNGKDVTVNYYYEQLPYKNLKLKLIDEGQQAIKEKTVKVYENQEFKPKNSDFLIYDLENFVGKEGQSDNFDNKEWKWKIVPPSMKSISYSEIVDNQTEITYNKVTNDGDIYMSIKDQVIPQGSNVWKKLSKDFLNEKEFRQINNIFDYDFTFLEDGSSILYNNVNTSIPGDYKITYFSDTFNNNLGKDLKGYKEINVKVIPSTNNIDELENEINRLNSLSYLWLKKYDDSNSFNQNEFDSIDQNNILDNILNLSLMQNHFTYEIIDFQRNNSSSQNPFNHYSFKIKVSKNGQSKTTNLYTKNIWFKSEEIISDLDKQIQIIDNLDLQLTQNQFNIETLNTINASNIHQYISNWNQVISNNKLKYEVTNFTKDNSTFTFNILVTENDKNRYSKYFNLAYSIITDNNENIVHDEINRLNQIQIELIKSEFTNEEINNIDQMNFNSLIKNWSDIASNNLLTYKITNFSKTDNKFIFNIEVLNSNGFAKLSQLFEINFSIKNNEIITPPNNNKEDLNLGKIIGGICGSILGGLLIVGIIVWILKKKKNK